jgi:hypothetical protein
MRMTNADHAWSKRVLRELLRSIAYALEAQARTLQARGDLMEQEALHRLEVSRALLRR